MICTLGCVSTDLVVTTDVARLVHLPQRFRRLPFDVGQYRTVHIDMTDIYTLVPQIELHRSEISRQCRAALDEAPTSESPLSLFYPKFWEQITKPS